MKKFTNPFKGKTFWQVFKEELFIVPIVMLLFLKINRMLVSYYPKGFFFDPSSQFESIFYSLVVLTMVFWSAQFAYRMTFPLIHKDFLKRFYFGFSDMSDEKKEDYGFKLFVVFVLVAEAAYVVDCHQLN